MIPAHQLQLQPPLPPRPPQQGAGTTLPPNFQPMAGAAPRQLGANALPADPWDAEPSEGRGQVENGSRQVTSDPVDPEQQQQDDGDVTAERGAVSAAPDDGGAAVLHMAAVQVAAEVAQRWPSCAVARQQSMDDGHAAAWALEAASDAFAWLAWLLPGAQPAAWAWLLHCWLQACLAASTPRRQPLAPWSLSRSRTAAATAALQQLTHQAGSTGGEGAVAAACEAMLGMLRQHYLKGGAFVQVAPVHFKLGFHCTLLAPIEADALAAAAQALALVPAAARPRLAHAAGGSAQVPPPPPPPPVGSIVPLPGPLRELMASTGEGSALRRLLAEALRGVDGALALAHGNPGAPPLDVRVWPASIDFGVVQVVDVSPRDLRAVADSVASALESRSGGAGTGGDGSSLLHLLQLTGAPARPPDPRQQQRPAEAGSPAASLDSQPLLHFRALTVENASDCEPVWLLGGVAAPHYAHTLAALDAGRLFWAAAPGSERRAVRLGPGQQHPITLALSAADGPFRSEELGLLQQLLLLVVAVQAGGRLAAQLAATPGVAMLDVGAAVGVQRAAEAAAAAAAAAAGPAGPGLAEAVAAGPAEPAWAAGQPPTHRVFVAARRTAVALVRRPGELSGMMSHEARPYVSEALRRLFDHPPGVLLSQHAPGMGKGRGQVEGKPLEGSAAVPERSLTRLDWCDHRAHHHRRSGVPAAAPSALGAGR